MQSRKHFVSKSIQQSPASSRLGRTSLQLVAVACGFSAVACGADAGTTQEVSEDDGPHLLMAPPDPHTPAIYMDDSVNADPASDAVLQKMLAGAAVSSLQPARLRDMAPRSSGSVMMVTDKGVYEAEISYPPPPPGAQETPPESIDPRGWSNGVDNRVKTTPVSYTHMTLPTILRV